MTSFLRLMSRLFIACIFIANDQQPIEVKYISFYSHKHPTHLHLILDIRMLVQQTRYTLLFTCIIWLGAVSNSLSSSSLYDHPKGVAYKVAPNVVRSASSTSTASRGRRVHTETEERGNARLCSVSIHHFKTRAQKKNTG